MQSRGTSGPARSGSRSKKLPPAQLEAAIKKLEEAGRRATKAEVRARIAADIRNLRVLLAVKNGTAVAGATYAGHAATEPDLKVLASTGSVANEPFFVQSSLPDDARAALKRALLAPAELDGVADATGFREIEGNAYTDALATVKAAGKQAEDLVPGGWVRANEARRPLWSYDP